MEIENNASKYVKPSIPTPLTLRDYNISFFDDPNPNYNISLIFYYRSSQNDNHLELFNHLETTLSKTLTDFYPLAGRYIRHGSFIDCSDQGALYILAKANFELSKFLSLEWDLKVNMMPDLLPCDFHDAGEADDPLLSVKVTTFECGGVTIGMCISHKFLDMSGSCTFINNWALRSREIVDESELKKYSPSFIFSSRFPNGGQLDISPKVLSSSIGVKTMMRVLSFKGNAISKMREKLIFKDNMIRPSKVQLITTLLCKVLMRIDKTNDEQPNMYFITQAVNLRNRFVPKFPENSCGNFATPASVRIQRDKANNIDLQGLFELLNDSIKEIDSTCARLATTAVSDKEYVQLLDPYQKLLAYLNQASNDSCKIYAFSSWCKFPFGNVDFGWGKPIWRSIPKSSYQNNAYLMDDNEGEGIEAWITLNEKQMCQLEQDPDIKAYAT